MGAVGLHGHELVLVVEGVDEALGELQRRLAAGDDHQAGGVLGGLLGNFLVGHFGARLMLCVAEGAAQVAAAQPHEDRRGACIIAFALEAVEYLVNFHTAYSFIFGEFIELGELTLSVFAQFAQFADL